MHRLALPIALLITLVNPTFAVELVGINIDAVRLNASASCEEGGVGAGERVVAQGETQSFDLAPCGTIEISVIDNQILVATPTPEIRCQIRADQISFTAPENGISVPVILSIPPSSPGDFSAAPVVATGVLGGRYPISSVNFFPVLIRRTTFVIGGDFVIASGLNVDFDQTLPPPSSPAAIFELLTAGARTPSSPFQCQDGIDNDADGTIDLADKQCKAAADNSESQGGIQ